ncbi:hypothetical protein NDI45_29855, partial [Leptolyngbya sp. GB1-A1]
STRHDLGNAADLDLIKDGRVLRFTDPSDLPFFEAFVEAAASFGATGIGGDVGYMGPTRIHVGFGSRATWGGINGTGAAPNSTKGGDRWSEKGDRRRVDGVIRLQGVQWEGIVKCNRQMYKDLVQFVNFRYFIQFPMSKLCSFL